MKGAKGVIISITGGEDMRLMEVDEAANHIKELVDPDANIIWGSAFNNDLEGKIRVSVVATGIEADASTMPEPAKLFTFPQSRKRRAGRRRRCLPPLRRRSRRPSRSTRRSPSSPRRRAAEPEPARGRGTAARQRDDRCTRPAAPVAEAPRDEPARPAWLDPAAAAEPAPAPRIAREGGTLFERMSNIARGAAKAQIEPEDEAQRGTEPLDIPRFLNRQNNQ